MNDRKMSIKDLNLQKGDIISYIMRYIVGTNIISDSKCAVVNSDHAVDFSNFNHKNITIKLDDDFFDRILKVYRYNDTGTDYTMIYRRGVK